MPRPGIALTMTKCQRHSGRCQMASVSLSQKDRSTSLFFHNAARSQATGHAGRSNADRRAPKVVVVRVVPWWGVVSSTAAPVLLVGGWTVAAGLQPRSFNPVTSTISALAAHGAADRWVMTLVLLAVGVCDVVTGLALRPAAAPGRLILIAGGMAGVMVAANPEPAGSGSLVHAFWATIGFIALTAWPLGALRRGSSVPGGLRPAVSAIAAGALLGLLVWFAAELMTRGGQVGLAERVLTEAQAGWPLAVVLTCWRSASSARLPAWARRDDPPAPRPADRRNRGRNGKPRDVRLPDWSARSRRS
jgi:Protein of unknown function (DUF998)